MDEREELLEQIPLLACGALDPDERARAEGLLERHEDLQGAAASYRTLDALLARTLPRRAAVPSVRRHRPYCKDDLRAEPEVLCAACLTPHHRSCFSENRGCSLLGCHGTRSVSVEEPSLDVCPSCGEHTPSGAPFCAWCRTPLGGERLPRHATPRIAEPARPARDWPRFVAACAALLVSGLAVGGFFEMRQNSMMDSLLEQASVREAKLCEQDLSSFLLTVANAQESFKKKDALGRYAPSWDSLATVASPALTAPAGFEVRLASASEVPGQRYCAIVRSVKGGPELRYPLLARYGAWPRLALDEKGVHSYGPNGKPLELDAARCRVLVDRDPWENR